MTPPRPPPRLCPPLTYAMPASTSASFVLWCYARQYFSFVCSVVLCFPILGALCVKNVVRVFLVRCCKSQKWCSRARWRSFFVVLPVLGGVTLSNFFNTSAVGMRFGETPVQEAAGGGWEMDGGK